MTASTAAALKSRMTCVHFLNYYNTLQKTDFQGLEYSHGKIKEDIEKDTTCDEHLKWTCCMYCILLYCFQGEVETRLCIQHLKDGK